MGWFFLLILSVILAVTAHILFSMVNASARRDEISGMLFIFLAIVELFEYLQFLSITFLIFVGELMLCKLPAIFFLSEHHRKEFIVRAYDRYKTTYGLNHRRRARIFWALGAIFVGVSIITAVIILVVIGIQALSQ